MTNKQTIEEFFIYCELVREKPTTSCIYDAIGAANLWYAFADSQTVVLYSYTIGFPIVIYDKRTGLYYMQCFKPSKTTARHEAMARQENYLRIPDELCRFFYYVPHNYLAATDEILNAIERGDCPIYNTYVECCDAFKL